MKSNRRGPIGVPQSSPAPSVERRWNLSSRLTAGSYLQPYKDSFVNIYHRRKGCPNLSIRVPEHRNLFCINTKNESAILVWDEKIYINDDGNLVIYNLPRNNKSPENLAPTSKHLSDRVFKTLSPNKIIEGNDWSYFIVPINGEILWGGSGSNSKNGCAQLNILKRKKHVILYEDCEKSNPVTEYYAITNNGESYLLGTYSNGNILSFDGKNIYGSDDDDDDPKFEEETQTYKPTKDDAAALYPYFPSNILDELIMKWTETGSIDIALATVRSGDAYAKAFPGIRREDGSLRMQEIQYLELKDSMKDQLRNYNLNPDVFANEIIEAITGDVNIGEFTARLQFGYEQLLNNKEQVLEVFNEQYGYGLDETVLFAMFISPDISQSVLENQILVSQILAEAEISTTEIGLSTAEKFVQANISQRDAAQVFSRTEELSGLVGVGSRRGITITEEDIATGLAGLSPQELALIRRTQATSASESSIQAGAATTQEGQVTGLIEE